MAHNTGDDERSEFGDSFQRGLGGQSPLGGAGPPPSGGRGDGGVVRAAAGAMGFGRGPIPRDPRKFRYDTLRGRTQPAVPYSASKADRMTAEEAGDLLHKIHVMFGIDAEAEERICAFDDALWLEHSINGASMLQPGGGTLVVGNVSFDVAPIKQLLGEKARKFYRAYADDIADANSRVLASYDAYDPVSVEMVGQLRQVAVERGLQKYPHLVHDSSDACNTISLEERVALIASKRLVIPASVNNVDKLSPRVPGGPAVSGGNQS